MSRAIKVSLMLALACLIAAVRPGLAQTQAETQAETQVQTQGLVALARVGAGAEVTDTAKGLALRLPLSQPVPYRLFTLAEPYRLVLDFSQVDWAGLRGDPLAGDGFDRSDRVIQVRTGLVSPGWSRMVLELDGPYRLDRAQMQTEGVARPVLSLTLTATDDAAFRAAAGAPPGAEFQLPKAAQLPERPKRRQTGDAPLVVVLDPGHGGVDPGAERDGTVEASLMLQFALELQEVLLRRGGFEVVLTRTEDMFVPLEARITIARAAGADLFIALHADVLAEGRASGATVYTMSTNASDAASQALAERHDREDLLAGVDLSRHDDVIANVLMDLARTETAPRSDRLADAIVAGLRNSVGGLHKRPRLMAAFSVLKAPDIPSVLVELGFMSSRRDLQRLTDPAWRQKAAEGIATALATWAQADAAEAQLLRQ